MLPIALPGIVTGMALNATFAHGRHPVRLPRRSSSATRPSASSSSTTTSSRVSAGLAVNIEEASKDLGADTWQTFRYVTLPVVRTALLAGGLLAFALSFDEVIVTTFTAGTQETLPIWILANLRLPNQRPLVNVVAVIADRAVRDPRLPVARGSAATAAGPGRRV